jgi:hypothetical protein
MLVAAVFVSFIPGNMKALRHLRESARAIRGLFMVALPV